MDNAEVRALLLKPYEDMLNPYQEPYWRVEKVGPFGIPMLRVHSRAALEMGLDGPQFSHDPLPEWVPRWARRFMNPVLNGPATMDGSDDHTVGRGAIEQMVLPAAINAIRPGAEELADRLVVSFLAQCGYVDVAYVADRTTYDSIIRMMGERLAMLSEAEFNAFIDGANRLCEATTPLNIPRQGRESRIIRRFIRHRWSLGLDEPIDRFLPRHLPMWELIARVHFLRIASTTTTANAICNTWVLLRTMDDTEPYETILAEVRNGNDRLLGRAYGNGLGFVTPSRTRPVKALQDVEVDGAKLKRGQMMEVCFVSGNRDRRGAGGDGKDVDIDLNVYDPLRPASRHRHLAFGFGLHECPGQGLSVTNAKAVLGALARHVPHGKVRKMDVQAGIILRTRELIVSK